ncbi:MAG TPA: protein kinase [Pyrinomonadaceae bacterium]|nr:protein kinase [Pyrinomonadaceae bacterium]
MTPLGWRRVRELFASAVDLGPAARAAFLDRTCGDPAVRREVEALLASDDRADSFMETPAVAAVARSLVGEPAELSAGQFVGPYEIVRALRGGGMGEVYLARDPRLGRLVVLKLLPADFANDQQRVRRFAQEPRAVSALNHPNICVIYEAGKAADGRDFIAMEHVAGITLRKRIAQRRLSPGEAVSVAAQIADALAAAHAAGIIHRDIKPENIMLRDDGYVKVLDFGLAKFQPGRDHQLQARNDDSSLQVLTEPGTRMGTVQYMSPEQLRELPVDERTDIWSLGVVLHEMVTGRTPFAAQNQNDSIALILARQPNLLALSTSDTPVEFQQIVARAVSTEREPRYQTVAELGADLRNLQQQLGVKSGSVTPLQPSGDSDVRFDGLGHTDAVKPNPITRFQRVRSSTLYVLSEVRKRPKASVFAGLAVILALLFFPHSAALPPFQTSRTSLLTNSGRAICVAISPDGRFVAHASSENGSQALLLTGLATGATSVVIPAGEVEYLGITFSTDGNYLYLTRRMQNQDAGALYQVALPGGNPVKVKDGVDSPITFSPSGDKFSFVRFTRASGEYNLMVAQTNGFGERSLATRGNGQRFSVYGPAWSPDGESIVCGAGRWDNGYHMNLVAVRVADGREQTLGTQRWFSILQVGWLVEKGWLIMSAREHWTSPYQLWRVSYPQGEVERITNDTFEHESVSVMRDGDAIVSVQSQQVARLWSGPDGDDRRARVVGSTVGRIYGLNWTRDGKLVFASMAGNNLNISKLDPEDGKQIQLTVNAGDNYNPAPSPDGNSIVFASNRSGSLNIWRMNALDGSEPRQLTFGDGNSYPAYSADGQWVLYDNQSASNTAVWKVPIEGGGPVLVADNARMPVVSPDNQFIACRYRGEIAILPVQGGEPVRRLPIPVMDWQQVQWAADGRALMYIKTINGTSNIWSYDLATDSVAQLTAFTADRIFAYAWSADHTQLACQRGTEITDVIVIRNQ